MSAIAAMAAALAALLVMGPGRPGSPMRWPPRLGVLGWTVPSLAGVSLLTGVLLLPGTGVVLAVILGAAAWSLAGMARRQAARLAAGRAAAEVREAFEHLGAELAAGLPPGPALSRAALVCPALRPVAEAFTLGADVPAALRAAAAEHGRADLRLLAAAWQVAHHTGSGLADAVGRLAARLAAEEQTARLVAGELSSARATARLVAALPLGALTLGAGAGGSPWAFLLTTPPGLACLGGGLALGLAGLAWIEALTGNGT